MPIYAYECDECCLSWEELQGINGPVFEQCPECLQYTAKRIISKGGFILKGEGWCRPRPIDPYENEGE